METTTRKGNSMRTAGFTRVLMLSIVVTIMMLSGIKTFATDIAWTNTVGGNFDTGANWDGGVAPGGDDRAIFTNDQTTAYSVTNDAVRTIDSLEVNEDRIVLDLNGNNMTLTNATTGATGLYGLAVGLDENATMTLEGGARLDVETFIVSQGGSTWNKEATLYVQGAGTVLNAPVKTYGYNVVGWYGHGTLHIRDGGRVILGEFTTGNNNPATGAHGTVIVEGENSLLYGTGTWNMGRRSGSTLIVTNGAAVDWRYHMRIGQSSYLCRIEVDDSDMSVVWAFDLGRYAGNESTVDVRNGGQLKLFSLAAASYTDGITASVRVRGVNVAGTPSRLYTEARVAHGGGVALFGRTLESDGAVASLTVEDGATVDVDGELRLLWTSTLTIDNSTVTNLYLNANEGATYALTLYPDTAAVPLHSVAGTAGDGDVFAGNATITDMTFTPSLAPGFTAEPGDVFTVLRYDGTLTGTFKDRSQDERIQLGDYTFILDYGDGSDDAITLRITDGGTLILIK